jgi:hypothetical protein
VIVGYSSDERDAAVSGLVQGTLSFPTDRLGVRNQATPFEEVKELANSALLYDPDAVFYIINQRYNRKKVTIFTTNYPDTEEEQDDRDAFYKKGGEKPHRPHRRQAPFAHL